MVLPAVFLNHTCTIVSRLGKNVKQIAIGTVTGTFTVGQAITGGTSHATGTVSAVGAAYLQFTIGFGTFASGETVTGATGSATVNGAVGEAFDGNGELVYTNVSTIVECRFVGPQESFRGKPVMIVSNPRVLLPAGTAVNEGDTLTSTTLGFAGTFRINSVKQVYEATQAVVSHITCEIVAAGATGGS
jgi:hypothetical protein